MRVWDHDQQEENFRICSLPALSKSTRCYQCVGPWLGFLAEILDGAWSQKSWSLTFVENWKCRLASFTFAMILAVLRLGRRKLLPEIKWRCRSDLFGTLWKICTENLWQKTQTRVCPIHCFVVYVPFGCCCQIWNHVKLVCASCMKIWVWWQTSCLKCIWFHLLTWRSYWQSVVVQQHPKIVCIVAALFARICMSLSLLMLT